MWTCPAEYEKKLSGKGYTCVRSMIEDDKRLPEQERQKREKELIRFVPRNSKVVPDTLCVRVKIKILVPQWFSAFAL